MEDVYFQCVKEGSKLRIRVISPGYNNSANCSFPRNVRAAGAYYSAPVSALKFASGPNGKFFYKVAAKAVKVLLNAPVLNPVQVESQPEDRIKIDKIYRVTEDKDCVVCYEKEMDIVFAPCGHFCVCSVCAIQLRSKCPMCRAHIDKFCTLDMVQV